MKISLVGGGNIGGTMAHLLALKQIAQEIAIIDLNAGVAKGKALDILQSMPIENASLNIYGTDDMSLLKDSDVVIVTAGIARRPGMSRDDLLNTNAKVIQSVGKNIAQFAPEAFVIVVTNPLDAMAWVMHQSTGFKSNKVVGMAGILDTARMNLFLSQALNVCISDVKSLVLGSHGDSMVPLTRYCTVGGVPLEELINCDMITKEAIEAIVQRTRSGGAEIVELLKSGSAYYAPATSAVQMAESYIKDQRKVLPCSVCLNGFYQVKDDVFCGVPTIIGKDGVEKVIEVSLRDNEKTDFAKSVLAAKNLISKINL